MIKKTTRLMLATTAALMMSGSAFAACVRPADPEIPAGDSASGPDMLKAKKAVESYIAEIEAYVKCGVDSRTEKLALDDMEKVANPLQRTTAYLQSQVLSCSLPCTVAGR